MRSAQPLAVVALTCLLSTVAPLVAEPAGAQTRCGSTSATPRLTVSRSTVGARETAVVTVTGTNYLVPPHVCGTDVFGGIYLFFGWVQPGGQWGPSFRSSTSDRGLFGTTYSYPGEGGGGETRDDGTGAVRLVSFTAGGESGSSTPFHMDGAGNWRADVTVRGATYDFKDLRTGASHRVDCRVVQCGVFTIGAHSKSSRTNEQFTPIDFTDPAGTPIVPSDPSGGGAGGTTGVGAPIGGSGGSSPAASGEQLAGATTTPSGDTTGGAEGSVGEVVTTTTAPGSDAEAGAAPEPLRSEETAAVQEFGDEGGASGAGLVVGVVLAVMVAAGVGAAVLRRNRNDEPEVLR